MNRYNVVFTYKDGSTFECAHGITFERATQIKTETEHRKAQNEFSYKDLKAIAIEQQGGEDE